MRANLRRLLAPESLVVLGGRAAEEAVRQCRAIGYAGQIWPVHPRRASLGGVACLPDLDALPGVPDAAFVAVPREQSVGMVARLARLGTGGVVCHASGFAEDGEYGRALERDLVAAAGPMALIGPNCLGVLNYLDGAALWSEQHGGYRVERGIAILAQSGNLAQNLTMQRRSLPLAQVVTVGNSAGTGVVDLVEAMLADPRITAIGLCLEEVPEVAALSRVAIQALRRRVPIVVLKLGSSELGARVAMSHTSSVAGSDVLCDAIFRRLGMVRVFGVESLLETLKFLHVHGALPGARVASASCSGGEAAHVADLASTHGIHLPAFPPATTERLRGVLGDRVSVRNPLDYHTYIWGDREALAACFTAFADVDVDVCLLLLDFPRADRCVVDDFETTLDAFLAAREAVRPVPGGHGAPRACLVSSLPEGLPESVGRRLVEAGIAPMQGIADCLSAVSAAARIGAAQASAHDGLLLPSTPASGSGPVEQLDEAAAKADLATFGLPIPTGAVTGREQVGVTAARIGFPVVLKALSATTAHKSEYGGVRVRLTSQRDVERAAEEMAGLGGRFLVEQMVDGAVLELMVGVRRDPKFGLSLTLGAGGVLVELIRDTVTLLLPATPADVLGALRSLRVWPLLSGFRGQAGKVGPVVDAIAAVVAYAGHHADRLVEVEVNPLLVLPGHVVAVDALVRRVAGEPASRRTSVRPNGGR